MTAANVMDVIARLPDCDGQAADAMSAYTQVKMEDAQKLLKNSHEDPVVPLERNFYGHPLEGLLWERQFEKALMALGWKKYQIGNACSFTENKNTLPLRSQHHFLITFIQDALNGDANQTRKLLDNTTRSRISAGATEKLPGWDKPRAKTSAWVLHHGRTCSKMRGTVLRIGKQKDGATFQSFSSLFGRSPNQKGRTRK